MDEQEKKAFDEIEEEVTTDDSSMDEDFKETPEVDHVPSEENTVGIIDENQEVQHVPVKKQRHFKLSSVLMVLLSAVLIGGSTYTIGYYNGQINLNEDVIDEKVQALLEKNYNAEIYQSVKEYIEETGINAPVTDADVTEIYNNVVNSVVGINSKTTVYDWFNNQQEVPVSGSGVIFDETSQLYYIVTNYHVVSEATDIVVELAKDQIVNAKLVGYDELTDLAVLTIQKTDIHEDVIALIKPIKIGDSEALKIGEVAIAIGNPLGYNNSITKGIVSALDRQVDGDTNIMYIQTDAAINPGNSGGALVNGKGELIGINTAKIADTDVEGMGFAIPTDQVVTIVAELKVKGYVARPFIGIGGVDVDENTADLYGIPMGVLVRYIYEGSPADKAGIEQMDLIVGINDEKVFNMADLTSIISKYKPGDEITIKLVRDEKEEKLITVTLGDRRNQK